MPFSNIADCYERLEATTGRIEMTELLADLLEESPPNEIDKVCYLTLGRVAPDFRGIELGMGEKLTLRAISMASGRSEKEVREYYKKLGDMGKAAEWAVGGRGTTLGPQQELGVGEVHSRLMRISTASGSGSQEIKLKTLAGLLSDATGREARYIARIVVGQLRLGVGAMTLLDAMAQTFLGSRTMRKDIESKYNIHPDVGRVARALAERGREGLEEIAISLGVPVRTMMAQRVKSAEEGIRRMGERFLAEYKYDGERMQIHASPEGGAHIFSRRLEDITHSYPDVTDGVSRAFKGTEGILDGECVAVDPNTGHLLPFQDLMHRRRKYGIEEAMREFPVVLYLFDALYLDGEALISRPLEDRRKSLGGIIEENEVVRLATGRALVPEMKELEVCLNEAISAGTEGLILKDLGSVYEAGARGWSWIKLKRSYISKMVEPIDLVVIGAFWGRGKRAGTYGALLLGAFNQEEARYETVCKLGTGFKDEELEKLPNMLAEVEIGHKHPSVVSNIEADVWFVPSRVIEVLGDEITLSPVHTCAWGELKEGAGLAIRFPRFTGRWREDKSAEDATSSKEMIQMCKEAQKG